MRRAAAAAIAFVAALAPAAHAAPSAPLATFAAVSGEGTIVTRLEPRTLTPVGPSVDLMEYHDGWDYSPDGSMIAFGKSPAGGNSRGAVHVVQVRPLRRVQIIDASVFVGPLAWLRERRLVGLAGDNVPILADPVSGRRLRTPRSGSTGACVPTPAAVATDRVLVWLTNRGLVTANARGRIRVARLRGGPDDCWGSGLAIDERRNRAWVVTGPDRIGSVNLRTMRASRHRFSDSRVGVNADRTTGLWLGRGRIAAAHNADERPRGVEIIATRSRTRRPVDRRAGEARFARGTLLTFSGLRAHPRFSRRIGVRAHSRTGRRRYQLLRGERVWNVQVAGRHAWAIGTNGVTVFRVRSGRIVSRSPRRLDAAEIEFLTR
jgi:hypothetical protein